MTIEQVSPDLLMPLSAFLEEHLGLSFPPSRWRDLAKGLQAAAQELGRRDVASLAEQLLQTPASPDVLAVLASQLTIGETYFFREKGMFAFLANKILPPLLAARRFGERRLRLWSAGCASGEEAYSLAIVLHQTIPDWQNWQIVLLATDVNPRALAKAREGIYSRWSFRGVPASLLATYFESLPGDRWEIKPWIKKLVTFAPLNLAKDPFPCPSTNTCDVDIIFCRNVLMYLSSEATSRIVEKFAAALREGGWLLVSPAECSLIQEDCFQPCHQPNAIPFQKVSAPTTPRWLADRPTPRPAAPGVSPHAHPPGWPDSTWSAPPTAPWTAQGRESQGLPTREPDRAKVANPGAPPPLATSAVATGDDIDVELARKRRLAEVSGDAGAMAALARLYANLGRLEEANLWGERAICQDCLNPHHYYLRAAILLEQNQPDEASRLLKQALYLQNDFVLAHFSLGRLALEQQRRPEALRHFNNVLFILNNFADEEPVPAADGLTMGALRQAVLTIKSRLAAEGKTGA